MRLAIGLVLSWLMTTTVIAQEISRKTVNISETEALINIDGHLDEAVWKNIAPAKDFYQTFPYDSSLSDTQCEIRFTYDKNNIYIGARCNDLDPSKKFVILSKRRDFRGPGIESLNILLDPFQDQTNAYAFGLNPLGVQKEGLVANGGNQGGDLSLDWDNKWKGESFIGDGFWSFEMAIPFKTIRFPEGSSKWYFNAYRVDSKTNERATWNRVPRNFRPYALSYSGELIWDKPLPKPGSNISVIPFVSSGLDKDFEEGTATTFQKAIGGDVKIALTPSMNLDLTLNPDFSQVEVDKQVTNVDRFEIFFPERRQFFLENADLFAAFGNDDARPFFSRRIGVAIDTSTGSNVQNKIYGGFRLNGKLNNRLRVGLLNMQAAEDNEIQLPSINYTVAAVQQQVFSRSNISTFFINKQSFNGTYTDKLFEEPVSYNRVLGIDYNLASITNTWTGKIFYHQSFQKQKPADQYSHGASLRYSTQKWEVEWNHAMIGENYNAEVGFVKRTNINSITPKIAYKFYPKSGKVNNHGPGSDIEYFWNSGGRTDQLIRLSYDVRFQNNANARISYNNRYTKLLDDFDPTRTPDEDNPIFLPAGSGYQYQSYWMRFESDRRKIFSYELKHSGGEYYNGTRYEYSPSATYRFQPFGSLTLEYSLNRIKLPLPYPTRNIHLIGPRLDLTLTKKLFLTNFMQFNTQNENVNINARLQWRFKPASDIFLVYTDNYMFSFEDPNSNWMPRTRALVFKMTYWLNL
ncbi:MAG: carbohydrate binding family 9 domain-containing protein [Cyclobacteriaceae bacterium]|nr:carbohydrate binding family 9 domain-containing protein [Cyclobacteriaceae bacterium]